MFRACLTEHICMYVYLQRKCTEFLKETIGQRDTYFLFPMEEVMQSRPQGLTAIIWFNDDFHGAYTL